jgi:hypothetical protein
VNKGDGIENRFIVAYSNFKRFLNVTRDVQPVTSGSLKQTLKKEQLLPKYILEDLFLKQFGHSRSRINLCSNKLQYFFFSGIFHLHCHSFHKTTS